VCWAEEGLGASWSYTGDTGPEHWQAVCQTGKSQSPVDLNECQSEYKMAPSWEFTNFSTKYSGDLVNNGHTAKLTLRESEIYTEGGNLPGKYIFAQAHFHWGLDSGRGSEHLINGDSYPMEVHLVHFNTKYQDIGKAISEPDGLAVLGTMFHISETENPDLFPVMETMPTILNAQETRSLSLDFSLDKFLPKNTSNFFRYSGSLTTPGCFEVVTWTVFKDSIPISESQLNIFRSLVDSHQHTLSNNYRPVQALHGRSVYSSVDHACSSQDDRGGHQTVTVAVASLSSLASVVAIFGMSGFAFMELGTARARTEMVLIKYLGCLLVGALAYWTLGFGLCWGSSAAGFIGTNNFFTLDVTATVLRRFAAEVQFPVLSAFIISSALGGRATFRYSLVLTFLLSALFFSVLSHWAWNEKGWLRVLGFHDTAGSGLVHLFSGVFSLVGLRFARHSSSSGRVAVTSGMNLHGFGVILVIVTIIVQNTTKIPDSETLMSQSILNTLLCMSPALLVYPLYRRLCTDEDTDTNCTKWINCLLAAAVATRAGSELLVSWGALLLGLMAALLYLVVAQAVPKLGVEDRVDAVSVNVCGGLLGLALVPLLRQDDVGFLHGAREDAACALGWNLVGCLVMSVWGAISALIITFPMYKLGIFTKEEVPDHNEQDYATTRNLQYKDKPAQ